MDNNVNGRITKVINIKEIIWDLLSQWKAVLVVSLAMMLIVTGAKYAKDMRAFNADSVKRAAEVQSDKSVEERIDDIVNSLPEEERSTVKALAKQNEWLADEKEYVNNSIFMNTDPTNQRTLILNYYVSTPEEANSGITSLIYGYAGYLNNETILKNMADALGSDAEIRYIAELISANNGNSSNGNSKNALLTSVDDRSAVMEVRIVLPDHADASAVEKAVSESLSAYSKELDSSIGPNSIRLLGSSEAYVYNTAAVENRNDVMGSIYNLTNYLKNFKTMLSDGQKTALDEIYAIQAAKNKAKDAASDEDANTASAEETASKPDLSKKYALLGFVLGALMYAFIYLLLVIYRGCINSAGEVVYYTQSRLLGEIYNRQEHKGLDTLFHSKIVDNYRYKGRLDEEKQIHEFASAVEGVCKHAATDDVSVFCMSGLSDINKKALAAVKARGFDVSIIDIGVQADEEFMLDTHNVVCMADKNSKVDDLLKIVGLMREYDVRQLGCVYTDSI